MRLNRTPKSRGSISLPQTAGHVSAPDRFRAISLSNLSKLPQWAGLDPDLREAVEVVGQVLPFRTNEYVANHLIDWDAVPDDPMFQLTFPQRGMLSEDDYETMRRLVANQAPVSQIKVVADRIRHRLNPHPAGQTTHNVPIVRGEPLAGVQHKYRETLLFFPSAGQTCHAYCTFCFRWAQFVETDEMKFAARETDDLVTYLRRNPTVTDVLITGGDPMIMKSRILRRYIEPLLEVESLRSIRIGTKALSYWPQRFVTDDDADDLLRLFDEIIERGKHLSIMAHYSHPVELSTPISQQAVRRVRSTGANIRMQSPVLRHINDDAIAWADLWTEGVRLGCVPYYMFVERDTGARRYFEMSLVRAWNIYRNAYQLVSGLARTVRGPSMSCFPGKCHILGVTEINGEQVFALEFLQHREPDLVRRPFFAKYDPRASWFDDLRPYSKADAEFFLTQQATETDLTGPDGDDTDSYTWRSTDQ